jgi:predicted acylesterase/phospholipase RssA
MKFVDTVSGSSAGALISGLIATGTKPETVADIMKGDFKALLGNSSGTLGSIMTLGYGWRDGQPIYNLLNDTIKNSIKDFLRGKTLEDLQEKRNINRTAEMKDISVRLADIDGRLEDINQPPQEQERTTLNNNKTNLLGKLDSLIKSMNVDIDSKDFEELVKATEDQTKTISFKHHKLLNFLAPETFKKLIITAVEEKTGKLKIFSADETPDVEIALTCRASAALPFALLPTAIDGVSYIDGGFRDNTPTNYNDQKNVIAPLKTELENVLKERQEGKTLVFAFGDEKSNNYAALYKNPNTLPKTGMMGQITTTLADVFVKSTSGMKSKHTYDKDEKNTLSNLQKRDLDVVLLDTKHIGTISFNEAKEEAAYLDMKGNFTTLNHLNNHNCNIPHPENLPYQEFLVDTYEHIHLDNKHKNPFIKHLIESYNKAEKGETAEELLVECFMQAKKFNERTKSEQDFKEIIMQRINDPKTPTAIQKTVAKLIDREVSKAKPLTSLGFDQLARIGKRRNLQKISEQEAVQQVLAELQKNAAKQQPNVNTSHHNKPKQNQR